MKSKYLIIRLICGIASIILALYLFIGNVHMSKLMPYILINLLVYNIAVHMESKPSVHYTKNDGIKIILLSILFFFFVTMVLAILHEI